jgi:hypothetical protein
VGSYWRSPDVESGSNGGGGFFLCAASDQLNLGGGGGGGGCSNMVVRGAPARVSRALGCEIRGVRFIGLVRGSEFVYNL